MNKSDFLRPEAIVQHIDIKAFGDLDALLRSMGRTSFQARNLARAAEIWECAAREPDCMIVLCLAGSLVSAGLKRVLADCVEHSLVDEIPKSLGRVAICCLSDSGSTAVGHRIYTRNQKDNSVHLCLINSRTNSCPIHL